MEGPKEKNGLKKKQEKDKDIFSHGIYLTFRTREREKLTEFIIGKYNLKYRIKQHIKLIFFLKISLKIPLCLICHMLVF